MLLDAGHVGELVREIAPVVVGLRVREVCARPPRDVLLVLERADSESGLGPPAARLLVSADPDAPRLHVQRGRFERHAGPLGPFFRRAIADLAGGTLRALTQVGDDRIVAVEVRATDESRTLVAELVGRHANLVLLGPGDRVLAVLVPPPEDKPDPRLVLGQAYARPPGRPPRARPGGAAAAGLGASLPDPGSPAPLRRDEAVDPTPLSWRVECALGSLAVEARAAREQGQLEDRVERKLKNARALVLGLEKKLDASARSERVEQDGELLKANLAQVARGARHVDVEDFFAPDGGRRRVDLDPKLDAQENLARLFDRAKKLARSRAVVASELALARARVTALEDLLTRARAPGSDPAALDAAAVEAGLLDAPQVGDPRRRKEPVVRLPYKVFQAASGAEIRVGRSARDNDDLTFRHAHGNDLWLHTADTPGSHVVLRLGHPREPEPEDVLDAAHLAAHFSPVRGARKARIHVARQKEVHKPRGAKPGLVTLSGGKFLDLRVQPERLARLLGTHHPPPGATD